MVLIYMVRTGQKWSEMVRNGQKWSELVRTGQKWSEYGRSEMVRSNRFLNRDQS